jgi:uncharacterized protein (TIGR03066 family)
MRPLFAIAVGAALLGVTVRVSADDKKDDKVKEGDVVAKLLGSWEITKADQEGLEGMTITFKKEGKFTAAKEGMEDVEGTYKIDENGKLITSVGESSDSDTIKKLTSDAIELENKDGKATIMKRKK